MATDDSFRARLDSMIDLRHPLAVLAAKLPWPAIEAALAAKFAHQDRLPQAAAIDGLFGVEPVEFPPDGKMRRLDCRSSAYDFTSGRAISPAASVTRSDETQA